MAVLDKPDEVAFAVSDERLPLLRACRAERVVGMGEDDVRFGLDVDSLVPQPVHGGIDVGHAEVDQGGWGPAVEQEAHPVERPRSSAC